MEQVLVKITKGVYGFDTGTTVIGKSAKDDPFFLDEDKAQRLFDLGVAEPVCDDEYPDSYVYAAEDENDAESGAAGADGGVSAEVEAVEDVDLSEMTLEELKAFAEPYGVKYKVGTKKATFVEQIAAALEELKAAVDENDIPPSFDAE